MKHAPVLDPDFAPASLWNRAYRARAEEDPGSAPLVLALSRPDGSVFRAETSILPHEGENAAANLKHVERLIKGLLWTRGGSRIRIAGHDQLAGELAALYSPEGERSFDCDLVGRRIFLDTLRVEPCSIAEVPEEEITTVPLGRHLEGCRIGFDLGGSDRKCAAVVDGKVIHSEEVAWNPYFESDPQYHREGIQDSLKRAAAHLPRVDAIGGSSAGVYMDNEPRVASLFRGLSEEDFDAEIRPLFKRLRQQWDDVPFDIVNDGEVTALAASMMLEDNTLLGISMGTSLAAGYCDDEGHITSWLNELAFVPVDYRDDAPEDEWSGDVGCGVQYFSQQGVARLVPKAGIELSSEMPFAEQLVEVQALMKKGDERAQRIYETIGCYFGYAIAGYTEWYAIRNLLILGRVTSGAGGEVIIARAKQVLQDEFPGLAEQIRITTPDEAFKRHGQAIAAASLPVIADRS